MNGALFKTDRESRPGFRGWLEDHTRHPAPPSSVYVHAPSHVFQAPGGGESQLVETARQLEEQGISVRPFCAWTDSLASARVLHLFGMSREGLELARVAKERGIPVVLSPICWFEPRAMATLARSRFQAGISPDSIRTSQALSSHSRLAAFAALACRPHSAEFTGRS